MSHQVKGHHHLSALLLAAPESGKTTITQAAHCSHVVPVAVLSGRSIIKESKDLNVHFLLFNDLSTVRALSPSAVNLAITMLNQLVQGEKGIISFAGKERECIDREMGIIGCMPFKTFADHRSRWKELGFVSRMIPFAYAYGDELIAEIKDSIDEGTHGAKSIAHRKLPKSSRRQVFVRMNTKFTKEVRRIADARANQLGQLGIRLLHNYHCLVRAHAVLYHRADVTAEDVAFLRAVDGYVSISQCAALNGNH